MYREEQSWYDVMQVCLNGHQINEYAQRKPEHRENFCKECGKKTIDACPSCRTLIRGHYHMPGVLTFSGTPVPKHCTNCGNPYPWQEAAIENL